METEYAASGDNAGRRRGRKAKGPGREVAGVRAGALEQVK